MNKDSLEHISSLMDGEIRRETSQFLIRRLGTDESLRDTWNRYHLIRDCLRHPEGGVATSILATRVTAALANEPEPEEMPAPGRPTIEWVKPFVGAAIAASVALMAVFAVSPMNSNLSDPSVTTASADAAQPFSSPNIPVMSPVTQQVNLSGGNSGRAVNGKMNSYLLRHYQVAGASAGKGFVSFVPIVVARSQSQPGSPEAVSSNNGDAETPDDVLDNHLIGQESSTQAKSARQ
jgi:sigma-E factor negative regulatory protein RseA